MACCYGLILVGGLSSRMGRDKAKLSRNGQTMLEYSQSLLESLGMDVLISGGDQGVPDLFPQLGPLAGIYTVIKQCQADNLTVDSLLIVPVDMPLLTAEILQKLVHVGETAGTAACYEDCYLPLYLPLTNALIDYFTGLFPSDGNIQACSGTGSIKARSIKRMLSTIGVTPLSIDDPRVLSNVNTPEEWESVKQFFDPSFNPLLTRNRP
jgi:molybdopterin-guanine dinucleotide biosynthesis protein A